MSVQTSPAQGAVTSNEDDVRTLYRQLLDGWNNRDAAAFAAVFAEDGDIVGFDGSQMSGRAEIEATLQQIFADHQTGAYVGIVRDVRFLGAETAILRAVAGVIPAGQADINPALNSVQAVVAVKEARRWQIVLYQNTVAQFHGRPELVQQLTGELQGQL